MSSGTKQRFKQFSINRIEDACMVLSTLIANVTVNLDKYKEYASEAEVLLQNTDGEFVPAKEFDDVKDKLLYRQREILKFIADQQKSSFSYIDLRKLLERKHYISSQLSSEISELLSELLQVRNWSFHNPQSLIVAAKEAAEKNLPDMLKGVMMPIPQLNPVLIRKINRYEIVVLASLLIHTDKRIEQFEKVLSSMKNDYEEMYASLENKPYVMTPNGLSAKVQYMEIKSTFGLDDYHSDIAQISMAIQKSKYEGTEEDFKNWVVRPHG